MTTLIRWGLIAISGILAAGVAMADDVPHDRFTVWAIGLPDGYVIMEHQVTEIHVTSEDVARGVLEVRNGSRIVITTWAPGGYAVDFMRRGDLFQAVRVEGIGRAVELGASGGTVVESAAVAGMRVVAVNYRFVLAPDAAPGTYAWPLDLTVRTRMSGETQHRNGLRRLVTIEGR